MPSLDGAIELLLVLYYFGGTKYFFIKSSKRLFEKLLAVILGTFRSTLTHASRSWGKPPRRRWLPLKRGEPESKSPFLRGATAVFSLLCETLRVHVVSRREGASLSRMGEGETL
jgi:hypothetical protein